VGDFLTLPPIADPDAPRSSRALAPTFRHVPVLSIDNPQSTIDNQILERSVNWWRPPVVDQEL